MPLIDNKSLRRALSPTVLARITVTFDRHMMTVLAISWTVAILAILFAAYASWLSGSIKKDITEAEAMEPSLPQLSRENPPQGELKPLMERLKRQYPEINIGLANDSSLTIESALGDNYYTWLSAVSMTDTLAPQYRWSIKELCIGAGGCNSSNTLMSAKLVAEKTSFTAPRQ
jgi:hypothetical protein